MVNAHCHLELSYLRGRIARGCGFAGFCRHDARARNETARNNVSKRPLIGTPGWNTTA